MSTIYVYEVMNPEVFAISPERPAKGVVDDLLSRRITSAPVVDRFGYPLGMLAVRDLLDPESDSVTAAERMSAPAVVVEAGVTVEAAARLLSAASLHRLVVIDELGRAIGIVSSLDIIRGLIRQPATHPWPFPLRHRDSSSAWCGRSPLEEAEVTAKAPSAPGVFILLSEREGRPEIVVWAETTQSVQSRLLEILRASQPDPLARLLARGGLLFRCVETPNRAAQEAALRSRS